MRKKLLFFIISLIGYNNGFAQQTNLPATQISVVGLDETHYIEPNYTDVVEGDLEITSNGLITDFTVTITDSYNSGDILSYNGVLPNGITTSGFDANTKSIIFNGTASAAEWQSFLRTVTFKSTSDYCYTASRKISFVAGKYYYNLHNNHFYEYVSQTTPWTTAKSYAESKNLFGLNGYMVTLTSPAENSFISVIIGNDAWIGCSDSFTEINNALGYNKYNNQSEAEGKFHWVTGPEKGTLISTGNSPSVVTASGQYANWANGEPNNWGGSEDYGQIYVYNRKWNDLPDWAAQSCIIEYGGMPDDNTDSRIAFTKDIFINGSTSGRIEGGNITLNTAVNSTTLKLKDWSEGNVVVRWESSLDNFLTNPTTINNNETTLEVNNIAQTTYYRAIVNSTEPFCNNLITSSVVIKIDLPTITPEITPENPENFCNVTLPAINSKITTATVAGAKGYRFKVTNTITNAVQTIDRPVNWFDLMMLNTYNYGTTYKVEVATKATPTGSYSGYSNTTFVCSPKVPTLTAAFCDKTVAAKNTMVSTVSMPNVTAYRFEIRNNSTDIVNVVERNTQWFTFNHLPANAYSTNTQYTVKIAVKTAGTWSPYGNACTINSPASARSMDAASDITENVFEMTTSPNPFSSDFGMALFSNSEEPVTITVYNLLGSQIERRTIKASEVSSLKIGDNYSSGVYNVVATQGENVKTLKVIKK